MGVVLFPLIGQGVVPCSDAAWSAMRRFWRPRLRPGHVRHQRQLTAAPLDTISKGWFAQVWDGKGGKVVW